MRSRAPQALFTARWAVLAALGFITLVHSLFPSLLGTQVGGPFSALGLIAAGVVLNVLAIRQHWGWSPRSAALQLVLDVAGLTLFLAISGAAANPFTMLYFVPIGLATLLPRGFTWLVAMAALAGFGVLLWITASTSDLNGHFLHHLVGMWLGLAISGATITLFVHRLSAALGAQQAELERAREMALQTRHLAALGGLAATAAHELGTPLNTIQLLVDELAGLAEHERAASVETIRSEVQRCKEILHSIRTPELSARQLEFADVWPVGSLEQDLSRLDVPPVSGNPESRTPCLQVHSSVEAKQMTRQPRIIIRRTLEELVRNAVQACESASCVPNVEVQLDVADGIARVSVRDTGPGLSSEAERRAFDAFFSTKQEGRGLGLFLARTHMRQLGGDVEWVATTAPGACFRLSFPLQVPELTQHETAAE